MRRYILSVVLTLLLAAFSSLAYAQAPREFEAELAPLHASGVSGAASLTPDGDELTVSIQASGLEAGMTHPQHIHGFMESSRNATCPTLEEDTDNNGLVDLEEGQPAYGPVLLPLEPFPTASDGTIDFEETYTVDPQEIGPLQNRVIVLHGMMVDGEYIATLPVACGQISPTPQGQGQQQEEPEQQQQQAGQQQQQPAQGAEPAQIELAQVELLNRRGVVVGSADLTPLPDGDMVLELIARGFDPDRMDAAIADRGVCQAPNFGDNVGDIVADLAGVDFFLETELFAAAGQPMGQAEVEDEAGAEATPAAGPMQQAAPAEYIAVVSDVDIQQLRDDNGSALIVRARAEGDTGQDEEEAVTGQAEAPILGCAVLVAAADAELGIEDEAELEATPAVGAARTPAVTPGRASQSSFNSTSATPAGECVPTSHQRFYNSDRTRVSNCSVPIAQSVLSAQHSHLPARRSGRRLAHSQFQRLEAFG